MPAGGINWDNFSVDGFGIAGIVYVDNPSAGGTVRCDGDPIACHQVAALLLVARRTGSHPPCVRSALTRACT
jgi:hypothetical protein